MTKDYLNVRDSSGRCPIIGSCISHLLKLITAANWGEDDFRYESAKRRWMSASAEPGQVCLRGFVAIELMLKELARPQDPTIILKDRSWHGLTALKSELETKLDGLQLDKAELQLEGVKFSDSGLVITPHDMYNSMYRRTHITLLVQDMVRIIIGSINTLRPYLKNHERNVSSIGTDLAGVYQKSQGVLAAQPLFNAIQTLLGATL